MQEGNRNCEHILPTVYHIEFWSRLKKLSLSIVNPAYSIPLYSNSLYACFADLSGRRARPVILIQGKQKIVLFKTNNVGFVQLKLKVLQSVVVLNKISYVK